MKDKLSHQIVIVGAGTAGVSVAARLFQDFPEREWDIAIIDPSEKHYYQPLWTLVGAGIFDKKESERDQGNIIPSQATWIKKSVKSFEPESNQIILDDGAKNSVSIPSRCRWYSS